MNVVTRFAPSPTGYLHIGGARTALFNWLFARHHGGRYLLRIEDTDRQRSTQSAVDAIYSGLEWLGLDHDGDATYQSAQAQRHVDVANMLVENGAAYRCYLSGDELEALRNDAKASGAPVRSPWRERSQHPDTPFVIRMKMPEDGSTAITDLVQGSVTVQNRILDDMVILRQDGTPTYMLAVVVDDHDMGITHVIRGDDHLNNAFRQIMVYRGMGWDIPQFAHIPLIHGTDGAKLSKRHGALGVEAYRDMGYLSDAMVNYLLRLGWGHGDEEIISRAQAIEWFDLDAVGKAPAKFDPEKLGDLNAHYLRMMDDNSLYALLEGHITPTSPAAKARVMTLMPLLKERAKSHLDIANSIGFLLHDGAPESDLGANNSDADNILDELALQRLQKLMADAPSDEWTVERFQAFLKDWLAANEIKMKDIGIPLRVAVTGTKQSVSIVDVIVALGRDEARLRVDETCKKQGFDV
jgi:glutamyl-tRNA synthetase